MSSDALWCRHRLGQFFVLGTLTLVVAACSVSTSPQPVAVGKDECAGCGMTIEDAKFACEFITDKGRCFKYDDASCLFHYLHNNHVSDSTVAKIYVADYASPDSLIDITKASLVLGTEIRSPMNGGVAAFSNAKAATSFALKTKSIFLDTWKRLKVQH